MTVLTVNRRKNMLSCFLRHTISKETLECRFRVRVNVILNIQTEHEKKLPFFRKSSPVQASRPLQAKFYKIFKHFQNQRGANLTTMHVKTVGGVRPIVKINRAKKTNPTSTQHIFLFSCREDVKLSYERQSFCQLGADENNRRCGSNQILKCFTK